MSKILLVVRRSISLSRCLLPPLSSQYQVSSSSPSGFYLLRTTGGGGGIPFSSRADSFSSAQNPPAAVENQSQRHSSDNEVSSDVDFEDVSKEELKRRIDQYLDGDMEAIPSIFEAILARKLAGKHDDTCDDLVGELRSKEECDLDESTVEYTSDEDFEETDDDDL